VGVVTSADSDARTDAVTAIHDRYPDVNVNVYDATVQGPQALEELLAGISALDENTAVDVIIVTRGGGADKTLRVFNELPLCRVIANTETPVVVGVGHENDRTLADEVADHRVMTPTHAGDIVPRKQDLQEDISQHGERLAAAYQGAVETRLAAFATALDNAYDQMVTSSLQRFESRLETAATRHIETELADLETQLNAAYRDVERKREHEQKLAETRAAAETEMSTMQRRYRLAILTLLGVLLTLVVILLLQV
jgi:exodeoxyribonuclease VII large subunit